jgi:hypothetical protein
MPAEPTRLEYDEPICRLEWGVIVVPGEHVILPDEATARLAAALRPEFQPICRELVYHPWRVMPKHREGDGGDKGQTR